MKRFDARWLAFPLALVVSGCDAVLEVGDDLLHPNKTFTTSRTFDVEVDTSGETPVISWELPDELPEGWVGTDSPQLVLDGNAHEILVYECTDCGCDESGWDGSGEVVWSIGSPGHVTLGQFAASRPLLESPLVLGTQDVPSGLTVDPAPELVPGAGYGIDLTLYEPCQGPPSDCAHDAAVGCATFLVPE